MPPILPNRPNPPIISVLAAVLSKPLPNAFGRIEREEKALALIVFVTAELFEASLTRLASRKGEAGRIRGEVGKVELNLDVDLAVEVEVDWEH